MITIAGFNSAIDRSMEADQVRPGEVMRVRHVVARPGGKGLHVALTCGLLGEAVRLVGVVDREHRVLFERALERVGGRFVGVEIDQTIRTCIAVRDGNGSTTELLEPGPLIDQAHRARLVELVLDGADRGPVVLSGSLPVGFTSAAYRDLIGALEAIGARCLLDASGEVLRAGLEARPSLVSPNRAEAEEVTGVSIVDRESARAAAGGLIDRGAGAAVISLGGSGIVAAWSDSACHLEAPAQRAVNDVGAGDSLVAGVAVGFARGLEIEPALRLGVACAAASVLHPEPGVVRPEDVERLRGLVSRTAWS